MTEQMWLAVIALFTVFVGAVAFGIREYSKAQGRKLDAEIEMQQQRLQHEQSISLKDGDRQDQRISREMEQTRFIQSTADAIVSVKEALDAHTAAIVEMRKAITAELGNGLSNAVRSNTERLTRLENTVQAGLSDIMKKLDDSGGPN